MNVIRITVAAINQPAMKLSLASSLFSSLFKTCASLDIHSLDYSPDQSSSD